MSEGERRKESWPGSGRQIGTSIWKMYICPIVRHYLRKKKKKLDMNLDCLFYDNFLWCFYSRINVIMTANCPLRQSLLFSNENLDLLYKFAICFSWLILPHALHLSSAIFPSSWSWTFYRSFCHAIYTIFHWSLAQGTFFAVLVHFIVED